MKYLKRVNTEAIMDFKSKLKNSELRVRENKIQHNSQTQSKNDEIISFVHLTKTYIITNKKHIQSFLHRFLKYKPYLYIKSNKNYF